MLSKLIKTIAQKLQEEKISYMIIGAGALLAYGLPRLTKDIDITLGISPEDADEIIKICKKLNLKILTSNPESFVKKTMVLPALDKKSGFRIDFIFSTSEYEKQALKRAKRFKVENFYVRFASPEDIIIHKLIAGRARDIEDIKNLLAKRQVDFAYIKSWLEKFDQELATNYLKEFEKLIKD
ncbi:MAG: hypothetical protein DRN49_07215 [Thaumarchaeota archaeon]|nr:MAG: hypothetical protein DRN49_07215 [Nitrososphaerota archaeon]